MSTARLRHRPVARWGTSVLLLALIASSVSAPVLAAPAASPEGSASKQGKGTQSAPALATHSATGFEYIKTLAPPAAACAYTGGVFSTYFQKVTDCIRIDFQLSGTETGTFTVKVRLLDQDGAQFKELTATRLSAEPIGWRVVTPVESTWPSGRITARVVVTGDTGPAGEGDFFVNQLDATIQAAPGSYDVGDAIPVVGNIAEINDVGLTTERRGVPATLKVRLVDPEGNVLYTSPAVSASGAVATAGDFSHTIPGSATAALEAGPETDFRLDLELTARDASYTDPATGSWAGRPAGSGSVAVLDAPSTLLIENSFVSSVGWVKPGDTYPFRVFVRNFTATNRNNAAVTIPAPDGMRFTDATALGGSGSVSINLAQTLLTWTIGSVAAATDGDPTVKTLVVEGTADTLVQDPTIVWKDLSNTAKLTYTGGPAAGLSDKTHGPKVIPPGGDFETARYGDKPFPMVPVDYRDRKHESGHNGEVLSRVVNSEDEPGSTFNLYQEMSFGQLFPFGSVPSAAIASADFSYGPGFEFSKRDVTKPTCRGATFGETATEPLWGTPVYPERINDGWYQLPGDTEYYGGDFPAFTLGTGSTIDGACGDTSKSVYDAAVIADPEIDYNQFDSDKDGVVDFFMMVFVGLGGNGDSQLNGTPPYDNIWPHSSSLEFSYQDEATGLQGYISDDQLTDLEGKPQCWTDTTYSNFQDCPGSAPFDEPADRPVYVRVGPYNVNPESAIEAASVISHEYGHHLGLPDFYSTSYEAYADWNLMASDYSQHMTIFSKQEMGWVVPTFLQPGDTASVVNWEEIKNDTHAITWQRPNGTPYTLSGPDVHNGQAYALKLPRRQLIDPEKVANQASAPYVWWSGRGNDFGCTPAKGHNLDIVLPELEDVPDDTPITVTYKSSWDIEWDWDYGFTMVTTNGTAYDSLPSKRGYTTQSTFNPNNAGCLTTHDNGLTGTSGSYQDGTQTVDRNPVAPDYSKGSPFLEDEYDLSAYAGERGVVLRFSYFTDPAFDRPGWFIDDIKVTAGSEVIYESDFSEEEELRIVNGGCGEAGRKTAATCTAGWNRIKSDVGAPFDHAYYLELRDRSGFDFNGRGQSDRGDLSWAPGVLLEYTDEVRGYGNNGGGQPPRQHYLDSQPTPGADCGDGLTTAEVCQDAAFTAATGDSHFDDDPTDPEGDWVDNFNDDSSEDGRWHFAYDCLELDVTAMSGNSGNTGALPSDLAANATIKAKAGCVPFDYTGTYPNAAPQAVAEARPNPAQAGDPVTFDGSGSTDDRQPAEDLVYEWDFTNNGTFDATGQVVTHTYPNPGQYTARLRVTDGGGLRDVTTIQVVVVGSTAPDLKVAKVTFQNLSTPNGKRVKVIATIKNIGDAAAGASQTHFRHASQFIALKSTAALPAGGTVQVSGKWDARGLPGRHHVDITADYGKVVGESNESNNRKTKAVDLNKGWVL